MVTQQRWRVAQEYEQSYWQRKADSIVEGHMGQMDWYSWKARQMEERLASYLTDDKRSLARILEIGSGPIGIVSFLTWGERYAIDPLENFYRSNPTLCQLRDTSVSYKQGSGERLPFEDGAFSLVILDNVLDHVHQASGVLMEINRVLSKEGVLYLNVNLHTSWGAVLHRLLSKLRIDRGHPYTFTRETIRSFISRYRFFILSEWVNDYYEARQRDRSSASLKDKAKGYIGLSEFVYSCICSKSKRE